MKLRVIIPLASVVLGIGTTWLVVRAAIEPRLMHKGTAMREPAASPYSATIAGTGVVEPRSESLRIGTDVAGIVVEVAVTPGDEVEQGSLLFRIDDRDVRARLAVAQAEVEAAMVKCHRLAAAPRAEEIPPLRAVVAEAKSLLATAQNEVDRLSEAAEARAVARIELERQKLSVQGATARLARAQAELELLLAGSWSEERAEAQAALEVAKARAELLKVEVERHSVRSPIAGEVLERNVCVGQYAHAQAGEEALVVVGNTRVLHVRVDIDETEAWRFRDGSRARVFVRGNPSLFADAVFVRAEPAMAPKRSLTGASTERTDTRVLRVIYLLNRAAIAVRVGELLDVRIEAGVVPAAHGAKEEPGREDPEPG